MDFVLSLFLRFPGAFQQAGVGLFSLAGLMIGLGWRLGKRLDRLDHLAARTGVFIDLQLEKLLPWWLGPFVPETPAGFMAWIAVGVLGLTLALTAKKLKRMVD
jgi:hypothetical protein